MNSLPTTSIPPPNNPLVPQPVAYFIAEALDYIHEMSDLRMEYPPDSIVVASLPEEFESATRSVWQTYQASPKPLLFICTMGAAWRATLHWLSLAGDIDYVHLQKCDLTKAEWCRFAPAVELVQQTKLWLVNAQHPSASDMAVCANQFIARHGDVTICCDSPTLITG